MSGLMQNGDLGPVYGYQWRNWPAPNGESIDQISKLIEMIKSNPDSRRLHCQRLEPCIGGRYGAAALSCTVSVLCG